MILVFPTDWSPRNTSLYLANGDTVAVWAPIPIDPITASLLFPQIPFPHCCPLGSGLLHSAFNYCFSFLTYAIRPLLSLTNILKTGSRFLARMSQTQLRNQSNPSTGKDLTKKRNLLKQKPEYTVISFSAQTTPQISKPCTKRSNKTNDPPDPLIAVSSLCPSLKKNHVRSQEPPNDKSKLPPAAIHPPP